MFVRKNGGWIFQSDLRKYLSTGKRPGVQGPIDDAFAKPFLCVRGTAPPANPIVGAWADASLRRFAYEWRRHYRGELPVKDDTQVTSDDLQQRNLILFGDPGSNRLIAQILPKLPVKWTRDEIQLGGRRYPAADHAIQLISESPFGRDKYVVLNSGHTYHDKELRFSYMVFPRLGDWAVTKVGDTQPDATSGSVLLSPPVAETVIESGFFNENWSLP